MISVPARWWKPYTTCRNSSASGSARRRPSSKCLGDQGDTIPLEVPRGESDELGRSSAGPRGVCRAAPSIAVERIPPDLLSRFPTKAASSAELSRPAGTTGRVSNRRRTHHRELGNSSQRELERTLATHLSWQCRKSL